MCAGEVQRRGLQGPALVEGLRWRAHGQQAQRGWGHPSVRNRGGKRGAEGLERKEGKDPKRPDRNSAIRRDMPGAENEGSLGGGRSENQQLIPGKGLTAESLLVPEVGPSEGLLPPALPSDLGCSAPERGW